MLQAVSDKFPCLLYFLPSHTPGLGAAKGLLSVATDILSRRHSVPLIPPFGILGLFAHRLLGVELLGLGLLLHHLFRLAHLNSKSHQSENAAAKVTCMKCKIYRYINPESCVFKLTPLPPGTCFQVKRGLNLPANTRWASMVGLLHRLQLNEAPLKTAVAHNSFPGNPGNRPRKQTQI